MALGEVMWFMVNVLKKPPAGFEISNDEVVIGEVN